MTPAPGLHMLLTLFALRVTSAFAADDDADGFDETLALVDCNDDNAAIYSAASEDRIDWVDDPCDASRRTRRAKVVGFETCAWLNAWTRSSSTYLTTVTGAWVRLAPPTKGPVSNGEWLFASSPERNTARGTQR